MLLQRVKRNKRLFLGRRERKREKLLGIRDERREKWEKMWKKKEK